MPAVCSHAYVTRRRTAHLAAQHTAIALTHGVARKSSYAKATRADNAGTRTVYRAHCEGARRDKENRNANTSRCASRSGNRLVDKSSRS